MCEKGAKAIKGYIFARSLLPDFIAICREIFCPCPAVRTAPVMISSIWFALAPKNVYNMVLRISHKKAKREY